MPLILHGVIEAGCLEGILLKYHVSLPQRTVVGMVVPYSVLTKGLPRQARGLI